MSNTLPITISCGALPPALLSTPQQLADMIAARLSLVTSTSFALFVTGSTAPASNVGPWLKDNNTWYVWDYISGSYVPQTLAPESLGYTIGANPPDPTVYSIWIETNVAGSPLAVKTYYSGAWVSVYAAVLAAYAPLASPTFTGVPAAPTAAPGTNTTQLASTAFVTAAIAAIPAPSAFAAYVAKAYKATQTIQANGIPVKIAYDTTIFNPSPGPFSTVSNRYIAPAAGYYLVTVLTQFDNATASAAGMEIGIATYVNGSDSGDSDLDSTPSPNGSRWSPGLSTMLQLSLGDYVEIFADVDDGVGAGNVTCTSRVSIVRVQA